VGIPPRDAGDQDAAAAGGVEPGGEKSGWGSPLPARHGRGVSCQVSFASFIATVAHVEVDREGEVKIHRLTTAVDTGIAVNPDIIVAQLQGGMIFSSTAALWGEITIDKGRVQQSNFPRLSHHAHQRSAVDRCAHHQERRGAGRHRRGRLHHAPPAIRNAIYAATGIPLHRLPIDRDVLDGRKPA